ncbi:hypothetical protein D7D52_11280 [Nocardia yunnanensis]|uniref:Uncharacterized protein n=2 Tax=Nocardia yunnanensis TaxID=2382165 RepID=A0A386Z9M9_9NOCA|nr:hypothetical protein D7D52_11280 [Nocardia yunnanensis]
MATDIPDIGAPDPDVVVPFSQSTQALAEGDAWGVTYKACVATGKARLQQMREAARRNTTALATLAARNAEKENIFWKEYTTEPTTNAYSKDVLISRWTGTDNTNKYYENTPDPKRNRIYSWQNERAAGEPLQNSDIYFFQYKMACGEGNPLPSIEFVVRQSAGATNTAAVNDYMRLRDNSYTLPAKSWRPGDDDFYAMLGTTNATAPFWLVMDHGPELRIASIRRIDRDVRMAITYHFEQIA